MRAFFLLMLFALPLHAADFPRALPATYVGTLPCADCPGIDTKLNLLPDGQFQLRMTYLERNEKPVEQIGLWQLDKGKLTLKSAGQTVEQFQMQGKTLDLRKLDMEGKPIASKLDYTLRAKNVFQPMKPRLTMQGTFVYFADSARFTPCATGLSMPVRMEGAYLALEKAYIEKRKAPGAPLLVTVEGMIVKQPKLEQEGSEQALNVMKLIETHDASTCPGEQPGNPAQTRTLENQAWILTQLGDQTLDSKMRQVPYIELLAKDKRVAGSGGCNRIMGGYQLAGDTLKFDKMAGTMMFCEGVMDNEQRFLKALSEVQRWSIEGDTLLLQDANQKVLMKLKAR